MSEANSPKKILHPYTTRDDPTMMSNLPIIVTDAMSVRKNTSPLHTGGCYTCVALIIVVKMKNGETWHGMRHESIADNTKGIKSGFNTLMTKIIDETDGEILISNHYLVTVPELRDKRRSDTKNIGYHVMVCSPSADVGQLSHTGIEFNTYVNVILSDGYIDMQYCKI